MEEWADAGKELTEGLFQLLEDTFPYDYILNRILPSPRYYVVVDTVTLMKYSVWSRSPQIEWNDKTKQWGLKWPFIPSEYKIVGVYNTEKEAREQKGLFELSNFSKLNKKED